MPGLLTYKNYINMVSFTLEPMVHYFLATYFVSRTFLIFVKVPTNIYTWEFEQKPIFVALSIVSFLSLLQVFSDLFSILN